MSFSERIHAENEGDGESFEQALMRFVDGCKRIHDRHIEKMRARKPVEDRTDLLARQWRLDRGPRYIRVVRGDIAHCFVDKATGDVLKADGWQRPVKGARGNIFDERNGLRWMGAFGPALLMRR